MSAIQAAEQWFTGMCIISAITTVAWLIADYFEHKDDAEDK